MTYIFLFGERTDLFYLIFCWPSKHRPCLGFTTPDSISPVPRTQTRKPLIQTQSDTMLVFWQKDRTGEISPCWHLLFSLTLLMKPNIHFTMGFIIKDLHWASHLSRALMNFYGHCFWWWNGHCARQRDGLNESSSPTMSVLSHWWLFACTAPKVRSRLVQYHIWTNNNHCIFKREKLLCIFVDHVFMLIICYQYYNNNSFILINMIKLLHVPTISHLFHCILSCINV